MAKHDSGEFPRVAVDEMLERANATYLAVTDLRAHARGQTFQAIRTLEERLQSALDGGKLRGAPNLLPDSQEGFYGYRIRGKINEVLPTDGRPVLVLNQHGRVVVAMRGEDNTLRPNVQAVTWPASEDDDAGATILAEDLEPVVKAIAFALDIHITRLARTGINLGAVVDLAARVSSVFSPEKCQRIA